MAETIQLDAKARKVPRAHHFLPKCYLRGFCDREREDWIWVYEQGRQPRPSRIEKVAFERDLYSYEDETTGELDARVEAWLADLEGRVGLVLPRIDDQTYLPSPEERELLLWFVALLFNRVPDAFRVGREIVGPALEQIIMEAAKTPEGLRELLATALPPEDLMEDDVERERLALLEGRMTLGRSDRIELAAMVESSRQAVGILSKMDVQFIHAIEGELFLTTDSPVITVAPPVGDMCALGCGFATPGAQVWVPLSGRVMLRLVADGGKGHATVPDRVVRILNRAVMRCAAKRAFVSRKSEKLRRAFEKHGCTLERGRDIHVPQWQGMPLQQQ